MEIAVAVFSSLEGWALAMLRHLLRVGHFLVATKASTDPPGKCLMLMMTKCAGQKLDKWFDGMQLSTIFL